jgi:glutathione peroxidase-family protein
MEETVATVVASRWLATAATLATATVATALSKHKGLAMVVVSTATPCHHTPSLDTVVVDTRKKKGED